MPTDLLYWVGADTHHRAPLCELVQPENAPPGVFFFGAEIILWCERMCDVLALFRRKGNNYMLLTWYPVYATAQSALRFTQRRRVHSNSSSP